MGVCIDCSSLRRQGIAIIHEFAVTFLPWSRFSIGNYMAAQALRATNARLPQSFDKLEIGGYHCHAATKIDFEACTGWA